MNSNVSVDLTRDLAVLAGLAAEGERVDELLRRGLDWLGRIAPYDLATVFDLEQQDLVVRLARGPLADAEVLRHRIPLDRFPSVREALESRRARAFTEHDHAHGDGDPFDGVLDLPDGHACMVVPLCAVDRTLGMLTLDRTRCEAYPQQVVDLVETFARLLALAIHLAEQRTSLERARAQEREHVTILESEVIGDPERMFDGTRSPAMRELGARAQQVARTDTPVLILGETGTGKERLARAVHTWSRRAERPFVKLNCAAIPAGLLESELFGHVRGSFTGATRDRAGRFRTANGGTLLLDEIGELPPDLQAKLLRVLQDGTFEPVGSDKTVRVDVRILAATHVDLENAVARGRFREDLYYRLAVFPLRLPPLRARTEDLPGLARALLEELATRTGRRGLRLSESALTRLRSHPWPGNVRQLANALERACILCPGTVLGPELFDDDTRALPSPAPRVETTPTRPLATLEDVERAHIRDVLRATRGKLYGADGAAAVLGMKPSTLQSRMKKLGIERVER